MIITQTPLRISFAGGGTDFKNFYKHEDGVVLSTAIDKYIFVIVKERFDDKICVNYSQREVVDKVEELRHELVRESMKKVGIYKGIEITTLADIPSKGSGLGSSSSVTVGLLNALYAYKGCNRTSEDLAREACEIEIDILKKPIGKQDQYIAAYGNMNMFTFKKSGRVSVSSLKLPDAIKRNLNSNLLLYFSGITRKSETILEDQKKNIKYNVKLLKDLKKMALDLREAILAKRLDDVGHILHRSWLKKKKLAGGITNPHIEKIYDRAIKAGALGGKLCGAGGGGFFLFYCPKKRQDTFRKAMGNLRELPFRFEIDGSKVIFNIRRYP